MQVVAVTSDMGSGNRAMWQHFDIYSGRYSRTTNKIPHPPQPGEPIVFFADVPHLIKNLNGHLVRGQTIVLPADVVTANNLTCPTVSLDPIRQLVEFQKNLTFKLVPKLRPELLDPNHFEKMKVSIYSNEQVLLCYSIGKRTLCCAMFVLLPEPTETNHENLWKETAND